MYTFKKIELLNLVRIFENISYNPLPFSVLPIDITITFLCSRAQNINQTKSIGQWVGEVLKAGSLVTRKCVECHPKRGRYNIYTY